ncbi:MAG: sialate O-acetylesterase, partial [Acetatifactor sp.]|nr:sialate O-acetylesterase [Acetatifactor sp.]
IVRRNLAVGEVWLAGGQSNMEYELHNCTEKEALNRPADPMLRFYYTQKKAYIDEEFLESEEKTGWECFGDPGTKCWSAVGYFFGLKLQQTLKVPVGIIGCNWGGTSASAWMPGEAMAGDEELKKYLDIYDAAVAGKTEEQQRKEYDNYVIYQTEFDKRAAACYAQNPDMEWSEVLEIAGESKWPGPMGCSNPFRPGGLYECMLKRVMPYSLKGFIYYQGESDDHLPHLYRKLFTRLIEQWREDWRDDSLPFIFTQLTMHRYKQDPDFKNWCLIREAQNRVYDTVKNTAMTCIIDQGVYNDIHPKMKRTVGERMCSQALELAYGFENVPDAMGPLFDHAECGDGELILHFKNADGGFRVKEITPLAERPGYDRTAPPAESLGFEIAGEDGNYVPAAVEIRGDRIHVSANGVAGPVYARYLWTNYGDVAVYGVNGIPLAPFRTDRRDGFTPLNQSAEVQQNMETGSK